MEFLLVLVIVSSILAQDISFPVNNIGVGKPSLCEGLCNSNSETSSMELSTANQQNYFQMEIPQNPNKIGSPQPQKPQNPNQLSSQQPQKPQNPNQMGKPQPQKPQNPNQMSSQRPIKPQNPNQMGKPQPQKPQNPNQKGNKQPQKPQNPNQMGGQQLLNPQNPTEAQGPSTQNSSRPMQPPKSDQMVIYTVPCRCQTTPEYRPVCGSDNQTYGNPSILNCYRICGYEITILRYATCSPLAK